MITYAKYQPTGLDPKGLNLEDRQDWYVVPVGRNRDSEPIAESNFASALELLGGESETVEVHSFGHWACGWFEILLLHPSRQAEGEAIAIKLDNYPILDASDLGEREEKEAQENWKYWRYREMAKALVKRFELAETTFDYLNDSILWDVLRHVFQNHANCSEEDKCAETVARIRDRNYMAAVLRACRAVKGGYAVSWDSLNRF